jgi:hypothetical protein
VRLGLVSDTILQEHLVRQAQIETDDMHERILAALTANGAASAELDPSSINLIVARELALLIVGGASSCSVYAMATTPSGIADLVIIPH